MDGKENVKHVSDDNFEQEVLKSAKPCLVDFWAPWCGPCKAIAPLIEEIAAELNNSISVVKLNVDENAKTAAAFKIRSIPTMVMFKGGQVVGSLVGLVPKEALVKFIEEGSKK